PAPRDPEQATLVSILAGYPDRVARRRGPRSRDIVLAGGGAAVLSDASCVREDELMVAALAEEKREVGRAGALLVVHAASAVEAEWLVDLFPDALRELDEQRWNEQGARVESVRRVLYEALVLEERVGPPTDPMRAAEILFENVWAQGMS